MFLAQMGTESSGYIRLVENLNYAADKLADVFGKHHITQQQADRYGRNSNHKIRKRSPISFTAVNGGKRIWVIKSRVTAGNSVVMA